MTVSTNRNIGSQAQENEVSALYNLDIYKRVLATADARIEADRLALEEAKSQIREQQQSSAKGESEKLFKGESSFNKHRVRSLLNF